MRITHAPETAGDTPEVAILESVRHASVHAHCHCAAEIGRVSATPRGFWWVPALQPSEELQVAFELGESGSDEVFVEGWCETHRACQVSASELLVQARRAQKTGQRRHMWLPGE